MSQHCNMSLFEKFANFGMTCGVKKLKFGYIFYARKKSPHVVRQNYIFKGLMQGLCSNLKNKAAFDFLTPPYFCDMCYFPRVDIHLINIKNTLRRTIKGLIYILSSSCLALFGSIFDNFQKNHFLVHFCTFLKMMDFPHIFVSSNSIRQKWI